MPSFGEKLKQEREKRKITLEQISSSTKIGTRMLQALEEDKFNQLPGGIFNKGFVRAYSRFVGLDEDQTVADYLQASGDAPPPPTEIALPEDEQREPVENIRRMEASSSSPSRPLPWGWFAAGLLVVALVLSLWSHHRREQGKDPVRANPATLAAPVSGGAANPTPNPVLSPASGTAPAEVRGNVSAVSPNARSGASALQPAPVSANPSSGNAASAVPQTQGSASQNPLAPGEFMVAIHAREDSWLSMTIDGKAHSNELLTAGNERVIRGQKEIVLRVGNAGAVDLRFNGKKLDPVGQFGDVKTVTFGPGGVVPNAPAPASTP